MNRLPYLYHYRHRRNWSWVLPVAFSLIGVALIAMQIVFWLNNSNRV